MSNIKTCIVVVEHDDGRFYQVAIPRHREATLLHFLARNWGRPLPLHPYELHLERIS